MCALLAAEMKRNDKIGELLHQRQERDIRELNTVLMIHTAEFDIIAYSAVMLYTCTYSQV